MSLASTDWGPTDEEVAATIRRCRAVAEAAWDTPFTPDPISPAGQSCIDTAAEERKERDRYEYGQLVGREMDTRW